MRWLLAVVLALGLTGASVLTADGAGVGVRTNVCPDPVQPAITDPADGTTVTDASITVRGTATGGTLVTVFRNGSDAGSALVDGSGDWELSISLVPGVNTLVAGTCAPSDPVEVTFETDQPQPSPGPAPADPEDGRAAPPDDGTSGPGAPGAARPGQPGGEPGAPGVDPAGGDDGDAAAPDTGVTPLLLLSAERSIVRGIVEEELDFPAIAYGGAPPYRVTWEWGDGGSERLTLDSARRFVGRHAYGEPGRYEAQVTATDAEGQTARYQFVADVIAERLPAAGGPSGRPWTDYLFAGIAGVGALTLVVLLLWYLIRRRRHGSGEAASGS